MEHITDQIVNLSHGSISVIVNCYQMASFSSLVPARMGCRIVESSPESIMGLTGKPLHFSACTECGSVSVGIGFAGDNVTYLKLFPEDPRSKLLMSIITETENHGTWGKDMADPARVVGMINVHSAAKRSENGTTCFNCNV